MPKTVRFFEPETIAIMKLAFEACTTTTFGWAVGLLLFQSVMRRMAARHFGAAGSEDKISPKSWNHSSTPP
jgi:hypothetical protein